MNITAARLSVLLLLALLAPSSAQPTATTSFSDLVVEHITSALLLPSALFSPSPTSQTFRGDISTSAGTTFYTLFDDEAPSGTATVLNFLPAQQYSQYGLDGYPFSAQGTGTRYVLPSQNLTINCLAPPRATTALCTTTSLALDGDLEPAYTTRAESSLYGVSFAVANATVPGGRVSEVRKVGVGLGVSLGVCVCFVVVVVVGMGVGRWRGRGRGRGKGGEGMELEGRGGGGVAVVPGGEGKGEGEGEGVFASELDGEEGTGRRELA